MKRSSPDSMSGTEHHVRQLRDLKGRAMQIVKCLCAMRTKLRDVRY